MDYSPPSTPQAGPSSHSHSQFGTPASYSASASSPPAATHTPSIPGHTGTPSIPGPTSTPSILTAPSGTGSGLRLTIPSLKTLKELKAKKGSTLQDARRKAQQQKVPRPIKLKPLREVLGGLIGKIKKKDSYAFFLEPVNPDLVPGYRDAIAHPMDFGTMGVKVERGRYRSLDEFSQDFNLTLQNAKTFNPPGTLYHSEAERIGAWGNEAISRARGTVIEFETEWEVDVERDVEPSPAAFNGHSTGLGGRADEVDVDGEDFIADGMGGGAGRESMRASVGRGMSAGFGSPAPTSASAMAGTPILGSGSGTGTTGYGRRRAAMNADAALTLSAKDAFTPSHHAYPSSSSHHYTDRDRLGVGVGGGGVGGGAGGGGGGGGGGKKGAGGPGAAMLAEGLEEGGRMPGWKEGVGRFPSGSEWARVVLEMKMRGKKYRTKKERMRMERGGPPLAPDGSLAYAELDDPFSILSVFVPPPRLSIPALTPIHIPQLASGPTPTSAPAPTNASGSGGASRTTSVPPPQSPFTTQPKYAWQQQQTQQQQQQQQQQQFHVPTQAPSAVTSQTATPVAPVQALPPAAFQTASLAQPQLVSAPQYQPPQSQVQPQSQQAPTQQQQPSAQAQIPTVGDVLPIASTVTENLPSRVHVPVPEIPRSKYRTPRTFVLPFPKEVEAAAAVDANVPTSSASTYTLPVAPNTASPSKSSTPNPTASTSNITTTALNPTPVTTTTSTSATPTITQPTYATKPPRYAHWAITRHAPSRTKKDREREFYGEGVWAWNGGAHPNAYFAKAVETEEREGAEGGAGAVGGPGEGGEGGERVLVATDWGGFVALEDRLKAEVFANGNGNKNGRVNGGRSGSGPSQDVLDTQAKLFDAIRKSVVDAATNGTGATPATAAAQPNSKSNPQYGGPNAGQAGQETAMDVQLGTEAGYWNERRARDAQAWLSEVVYGGVDGLALVRSLAEFVGPAGRFEVEEDDEEMDVGEEAGVNGEERDGDDMVVDREEDVKMEVDSDSRPQPLRDLDAHRHRNVAEEKKTYVHYPLGEPLPQYIERTIIDPLTSNLHSFIRVASYQLLHPSITSSPPSHTNPHFLSPHISSTSPSSQSAPPPHPQSQPLLSNQPNAQTANINTPTHAQHLASKVRDSISLSTRLLPILTLLYELSSQKIDLGALVTAPEELYEADLGIFGPRATGAGKTATRAGPPESEREKLVRGLERASESLTKLIRMRQGVVMGQKEQAKEKERAELEQELRLNLIALAKRAPLDMIAKMRKELLPEHLRGVVPTLD